MTGQVTSRVEYESNNSGGVWWLTSADWKALEAAGWEVRWLRVPQLGTPALKAVKRNATLVTATADFEQVTGANAADRGCDCCGPPHTFYLYPSDDAGQWTERSS